VRRFRPSGEKKSSREESQRQRKASGIRMKLSSRTAALTSTHFSVSPRAVTKRSIVRETTNERTLPSSRGRSWPAQVRSEWPLPSSRRRLVIDILERKRLLRASRAKRKRASWLIEDGNRGRSCGVLSSFFLHRKLVIPCMGIDYSRKKVTL